MYIMKKNAKFNIILVSGVLNYFYPRSQHFFIGNTFYLFTPSIKILLHLELIFTTINPYPKKKFWICHCPAVYWFVYICWCVVWKMAPIDWHWKSLERNSFWLSFTVFLLVYISNRPVFQLSVYQWIKKHFAFSLLLFCSLKAQKCVSGVKFLYSVTWLHFIRMYWQKFFSNKSY